LLPVLPVHLRRELRFPIEQVLRLARAKIRADSSGAMGWRTRLPVSRNGHEDTGSGVPQPIAPGLSGHSPREKQ